MKKLGLLVIVLFGLAMLGACASEEKLKNVDNINKEDIFNQEEDVYYIYFHRNDCEDCEESSPRIINYETIRQEKASCGEKRKVYSVMLWTKTEKPEEDKYIYREYTGSDGQGTDGKYYVNGVTRWEDLYIATTSSLIAINTDKDGNKIASYVAQGANGVVTHLENQLGQCYNN